MHNRRALQSGSHALANTAALPPHPPDPAMGIDKGSTTPGPQRTGPCHILVVDDDPMMQDVLTDILGSEGYRVTTTASAFGVVGLVQRLRPAAILLDLGLPYRSGVSVLRDLTAEPSLSAIPVVVVTALPEVLAPEQTARAAAVLQKPFDREALLTILRAICGSHQ